MQFTWISRAAASEQERLERQVFRDGIRAVEAAYDEVKILIPVIRAALAGWSRDEGGDLELSLASWETNTMHPGFLIGIWVFLPETDPIFTASSGAYEEKKLPEPLEFLQLPQESWDITRIRETAYQLGWEGFIPVDFQTSEGIRGLAVIEVETQIFFTQMLPEFLVQELPQYRFSVRQFSSEEEMERAMRNAGRGDELAILIPGFLSAGIRGSRESMFFFLADDFHHERRLIRQQDYSGSQDVLRTAGPQYIGMLTIDLSSGELSSRTSSWVLSNMVVSTSIIILLVLCLAAVFYLYRRTASVRSMEQEFTASMSHELRLPITVIKAIGENIAEGVVKDEARLKSYGNELTVKADRLNSMVEGILIYSGLQKNGKQPELSLLHAEKLVRDVVSELKVLDRWEDISFSCTVQTGEIPIYADTQGVLRMVKNLLVNAYYHGALGQDKPKIKLQIFRKPLNTLCIIVEDNGPGIPKNRQGKVLNPFYRLERSIADQIPGSGLGLYIVKRIAELNNGKLILESPYQDAAETTCRGCRVTVEIAVEEKGCEQFNPDH